MFKGLLKLSFSSERVLKVGCNQPVETPDDPRTQGPEKVIHVIIEISKYSRRSHMKPRRQSLHVYNGS